MECLYAPHLTAESRTITLDGDEFAHAKALRLREGEAMLLSNGVGLCAEAILRKTERREATFEVIQLLPNHNEPQTALCLALGVLDNRERLEMAIEKGTELGMVEFTPLTADHSQRDRVNTTRLQAKALAAMKQSQRSRLPRIKEPQTVEEFLSVMEEGTPLVLADTDGLNPQQLPATLAERAMRKGIWIAVGPEGGFSTRESQILKERVNSGDGVCWRLGASRLRAETAAVLALGIAALHVP